MLPVEAHGATKGHYRRLEAVTCSLNDVESDFLQKQLQGSPNAWPVRLIRRSRRSAWRSERIPSCLWLANALPSDDRMRSNTTWRRSRATSRPCHSSRAWPRSQLASCGSRTLWLMERAAESLARCWMWSLKTTAGSTSLGFRVACIVSHHINDTVRLRGALTGRGVWGSGRSWSSLWSRFWVLGRGGELEGGGPCSSERLLQAPRIRQRTLQQPLR